MEKFSVILPIYRDKANAEKIISSLEEAQISELDKIVAIVDEDSIDYNWEKLRVVENTERVGKPRAINQGLEFCETETKVLLSSDISIKPSTVRKLAEETQKNGGVTSIRIQTFSNGSTPSRIAETIWRLHHHISELEPKMGEAIAFNLEDKIPEDTVADEEYIASQFQEKKYIRSENYFNYPPSSLKQLYKQRRRVFCGHLKLAREEGYYTPTMKLRYLIYSIKNYLLHGGSASNLVKAGVIEIFARSEALAWDILGKTKTKWSYIQTSPLKETLPEIKT